jgi:hypothetical protein
MIAVKECHRLSIRVAGFKDKSIRFDNMNLVFVIANGIGVCRRRGLRVVTGPIALRVQAAFPVTIHALPVIRPLEAGLGKVCVLR